MEVARIETCPACSGTGVKNLSSVEPKPKCSVCDGDGEVYDWQAEEFWECVRKEQARPGDTVLNRCVHGTKWSWT